MKHFEIDPLHTQRAKAGMDIENRRANNWSNHCNVRQAIENLRRVHQRLATVTAHEYGRGDSVRFGLRKGFAATVMIDRANVDHVDVLIHKKRQPKRGHVEAVHATESYSEYLRWGYGDTIEQRPYMAVSPVELIDATFVTQEKTELFVAYSFIALDALHQQLKPDAVSLAPAPDNIRVLKRL